MNILIVDDDVDILESISNILKPANYNCKLTTSPNEAFELFKKYHFDVIITDIKMPEMDGKSLIKKIREINYDVRIIVVSAFCDQETTNSIINEHIFSFFTKPLDIREFINKLREIEKKLDDEKNRTWDSFKYRKN
jgi:YesN/AraC family two-component response regulator